ncbi:MAG TPA: hypothetical protein DCP91_08200 [Eggerthellaceae bacterium]|nr:hypothetical protein [Eggerthellaceae bacterium]
MATQDTVKSLVDSVMSNPDFLSHIASHPYSAVRESTGKQDVSRQEVSEAMAALSALMGGQTVDFGNISSLASGMLADNGGSAHSMASALFGGGSGGGMPFDFARDVLPNLQNINFERGMAGVDLSDGLGIDDVIGFAKGVLGR